MFLQGSGLSNVELGSVSLKSATEVESVSYCVSEIDAEICMEIVNEWSSQYRVKKGWEKMLETRVKGI